MNLYGERLLSSLSFAAVEEEEEGGRRRRRRRRDKGREGGSVAVVDAS